MAEIVPPGDGFEKVILGVAGALAKTEGAINIVAYGGTPPIGGIKFPGNKTKTSGLIPILREINKIDLCNILNYALGNISLTDGKIGEKIGKLQRVAQDLIDILDVQFIDPSSIKQDTAKIALLIGYLAELDELIDSEIVSVFPKIQEYKTNLNNLVNMLIQYQAATKSYEVLRNATEEALQLAPSGSTIAAATTPGSVIVTVESDRINMGNKPDLVFYTDLEVPISTLNALGRAYSSRERIVFQQIDLSQIPVAEVQRLVKTIREVRGILQIIVGIASVNDIASLLIPKEIQDLQRQFNPGELTKYLKLIVDQMNGANQVAQQVLGYINVARTIVKVITVIIKVVQIAIQIFRLLPMPLMFATAGVMDALVWARQLLDGQLEAALKRVEQLGKLIEVIYSFAIFVTGILQEVLAQVQILLYNLEACAPSPYVAKLKEIKAKMQDSIDSLTALTRGYEKALANPNETTYNGYIFKIEEEVVEEESITSKRRRAIAYDYNEIMVLATDLTFATDRDLLFEELRLKLINAGLIQDTGKILTPLADILNAISLPESTDDIYASIGFKPIKDIKTEDLMKSELGAVQKQINFVVSNLKGGDDLRKLAQNQTLPSNKTLKEDIKAGVVDPTNQPTTAGMPPSQNIAPTPPIQKPANPDILTDAEVQRLQNLILTIEASPNARGLVNTPQYIQAKEKLKKNAAARLAAGM